MKYVKLKGILRYDPYRGSNFKKTHKLRTLVIEIKPGALTEYYQYVLRKKYGTYIDLSPPMFGYHVTVVSGKERDFDLTHWGKYNNQEIEIEYDSETLTSKYGFWYLDVVPSIQLKAIRKELGLRENFEFHLTIGRNTPVDESLIERMKTFGKHANERGQNDQRI